MVDDEREPVYADTVLITRPANTVPQQPDQLRNTSAVKAVFNLTKSAIGLGALFLPGNLKRMGLVGGTLMILLASLTCTLSLHFLARTTAHHPHTGDYFGIGARVSGGGHAAVVAAALVLFQIGGLIAYAAFAGQYTTGGIRLLFGVGGGRWWLSPQLMSIVLATVFIFPLSCMRDMSRIANASILGMVCVFYIFGLTVLDFLVHLARGGAIAADITLFRVRSDFLNALSSIVFAYVNHFTLVSLIPVLVKPSPARRTAVIASSSLLVTMVYLGTGLCGYLHFGDQVAGDILSSGRGVAYGIGQLAMGLVLIASYPLQCDPTRTASDKLLLQAIKSPLLQNSPQTRHYAWTAFYVLVPTLIAVTLRPYVMPILEVFSSACGSLLVFILPPFYFLQTVKRSSGGGGDGTVKDTHSMRMHTWEWIFAYCNIVFGVVVLFGGTIGAVIDMVRQFRSMP
jgi:amino acid permease